MAKDWIASAVKHPGSLTREAKSAGKSISAFCAGGNKTGMTDRRCALADTLKRVSEHKYEYK
jgi:hypothetical protein